MEERTIARFIIIDDDPLNNLICRRNIQHAFPDAEIHTFTEPQTGLDHITSEYDTINTCDTVLLLDINMPILSGWDVLDKLAELSGKTTSMFRIYMLSSSIAVKDKQRADACPIVSDLLTKPLKKHDLAKMCD
jgi:CheY-like chemotaxis protein